MTAKFLSNVTPPNCHYFIIFKFFPISHFFLTFFGNFFICALLVCSANSLAISGFCENKYFLCCCDLNGDIFILYFKYCELRNYVLTYFAFHNAGIVKLGLTSAFARWFSSIRSLACPSV